MPAISVLMKPSSGMCNMSCDYCFYCDETQKRTQKSYGFMSEQTLKNVIRRTMLQADPAISYAFQGGEPTLRGLDFFRKVIEYQKQYNKNNILVQNALQTNGYAIDEDWCVFLKEHNFLVGVSIDGTKAIHDSLRHTCAGGDTYDRVLQATRLMDKYQVDYNILTVVTPAIANNITSIYNHYKQQGWNYQQYIACLDPLGEGHGKTAYSLSPKLYGQFLIDLFNLWEKDCQRGKQPYIRQFENYVGLAAGYMPEACDQKGICSIQYVVEADGGVYPCDFFMLDEYRLGNFNEDRLSFIDSRRKDIHFIERSLKLTEKCGSCPYYSMCRGGCQRYRDLNQHTGLYENYFCESYQMFFDACYERIVNLGNRLLNSLR